MIVTAPHRAAATIAALEDLGPDADLADGDGDAMPIDADRPIDPAEDWSGQHRESRGDPLPDGLIPGPVRGASRAHHGAPGGGGMRPQGRPPPAPAAQGLRLALNQA